MTDRLSPQTETPDFAYIICVEHEFDQVCETREDAVENLIDFEQSLFTGCSVTAVRWHEQDAAIDQIVNTGATSLAHRAETNAVFRQFREC